MILKSLENNKKAHLSLLWNRKMNDIRHFDILTSKDKNFKTSTKQGNL